MTKKIIFVFIFICLPFWFIGLYIGYEVEIIACIAWLYGLFFDEFSQFILKERR